MTRTTRTFAPAGVLGQGIADVRPYRGVVCPVPEAVQGSGLPAGGFAVEVRGMTGDISRLRPPTGSVTVLAGTHEPVAQNFSARNFLARQSTHNDDTTFGIRFPGRPQS